MRRLHVQVVYAGNRGQLVKSRKIFRNMPMMSQMHASKYKDEPITVMVTHRRRELFLSLFYVCSYLFQCRRW